MVLHLDLFCLSACFFTKYFSSPLRSKVNWKMFITWNSGEHTENPLTGRKRELHRRTQKDLFNLFSASSQHQPSFQFLLSSPLTSCNSFSNVLNIPRRRLLLLLSFFTWPTPPYHSQISACSSLFRKEFTNLLDKVPCVSQCPQSKTLIMPVLIFLTKL